MSDLIIYDAAKTALDKARRIDEVKDIHDKVEAVRVYATLVGDKDLLIWSSEIKLQAERKGGELLTEMGERGERDPGKGGDRKSPSQGGRVKLADLGISFNQSSRWQLVAKLSEHDFQEWLDDFRYEEDRVPTSASLRSFAERLLGVKNEKQSAPKSDDPKRIYFGRPLIGDAEKKAVVEALGRTRLTNGGLVKQFEAAFEEYAGGGKAVAVSSCTAALHIACMRFFGPGDEVIMPALTHVATAHAVEAVGATPVFVDVSRETGNVEAQTISDAITSRTKGVIVVHYLGRPCDMPGICMVTRLNGLKLIEDCALALGARLGESHVGLFGDAGCFSFYPIKHMTTGEGGMLLTKHPELAEDAKLRRAFGQQGRHGDVTGLGLNYRLTEMQAALGLEQIKRLPRFMKKRQTNFNALLSSLPGLKFVNSRFGAFYGLSVFMPSGVDQKWALQEFQRRGCEFSIYYPRPVPLLTYYREKYGYKAGQFPISEEISSRTICLPVGPHLNRHHIAYMSAIIKEVLSCESPLSEVPASSATMLLSA